MHKVLMSFTYRKGWHVCFFDADRDRRQLPRLAFFRTDEAMVEFTRRASHCRTLEDKNILEMMIQRGCGEIILDLTDDQYQKLRQPPSTNPIPKRPSASARDAQP
jgi:hypothetical protein